VSCSEVFEFKVSRIKNLPGEWQISILPVGSLRNKDTVRTSELNYLGVFLIADFIINPDVFTIQEGP
jgi:hypothetical protein